MVLNLDPLQSEFVKTLTEGAVSFIIIGGVAVNFHIKGLRPTHDLDVLSKPDAANAARLAAAAQQFARKNNTVLPISASQIARLSKPKVEFPLWSADRFIGIEILSSIEDVTYQEAFEQAAIYEESGLRVAILSKQHLIQSKMKLAAHDDKHRADVASLMALPP